MRHPGPKKDMKSQGLFLKVLKDSFCAKNTCCLAIRKFPFPFKVCLIQAESIHHWVGKVPLNRPQAIWKKIVILSLSYIKTGKKTRKKGVCEGSQNFGCNVFRRKTLLQNLGQAASAGEAIKSTNLGGSMPENFYSADTWYFITEWLTLENPTFAGKLK